MQARMTAANDKLIWAAIAVLALAGTCAAQQTSGSRPVPQAVQSPQATPNDTLRSPETGPGGRVTFRLNAPNAREVKLQADGTEASPGATFDDVRRAMAGYPMKRAENGVWSIVFGPVPPGIYRYSFLVDGVQTADPRNPDSTESLMWVKSLYEVSGASFMEYRDGVPHGTIASAWYSSKAAGRLRRMHIYTPPGYERDNQRYPVLYLLHGGGDTDDSWPKVGRAGAILDNLIAEHQAVPMIVVMPAGHITRDFRLAADRNSMGRDQFNDDLVGDILPWVDANYRTQQSRERRAIAGLSMGGLQTLTVSLTHSDLFAWVGVFSSGWFEDTRQFAEQKDLVPYKSSGKPFNLFWVGVAKDDIANANSAETVKLLKKYGIVPATHFSEGFHAWNNWRDYLNLFAPKLFR